MVYNGQVKICKKAQAVEASYTRYLLVFYTLEVLLGVRFGRGGSRSCISTLFCMPNAKDKLLFSRRVEAHRLVRLPDFGFLNWRINVYARTLFIYKILGHLSYA